MGQKPEEGKPYFEPDFDEDDDHLLDEVWEEMRRKLAKEKRLGQQTKALEGEGDTGSTPPKKPEQPKQPEQSKPEQTKQPAKVVPASEADKPEEVIDETISQPSQLNVNENVPVQESVEDEGEETPPAPTDPLSRIHRSDYFQSFVNQLRENPEDTTTWLVMSD